MHATPTPPPVVVVIRSRDALNAAFAEDAALVVKAALKCGTFSAMMNTKRADHLPCSGVNITLSSSSKGEKKEKKKNDHDDHDAYWRVFVTPDADAEFDPSAAARHQVVLLCGLSKLPSEFDWTGFLRWRQDHPVLHKLAAVCAVNGTLRGWILTPDEAVIVTFKLTLNGRLVAFATRVAHTAVTAVVAHDSLGRTQQQSSSLSVKMALFGHAMDEFCERFRLDGCELASRLSRNIIRQINVAEVVPLLTSTSGGGFGGSSHRTMVDVRRRSSRAGHEF